MNIEDMLREQFTEAADGLEPVADLVPSALREGRRRQSTRRGRLLVATVSAGAVAASAATLAAAHIGAGRSPSGPAATAPAISGGTAGPGTQAAPTAFSDEAQGVLGRLFPGSEVTVRPKPESLPARPTLDPRAEVTDPNGRAITQQELDLWWGTQRTEQYAVTMHNGSGTVSGVLMFAYVPEDSTPTTVSKSCTTEEQFLRVRGLHVNDCMWGTRDDYSAVQVDDVEGVLHEPGADGAAKGPEADFGRRYVGGDMYHKVLWGLTLYGDKSVAPAGISLAEMYGAMSDMRFAQLVDAWLASADSRPLNMR